MDDLMSLDWDKTSSSNPPSQQAKKPAATSRAAPSAGAGSYSFDVLTKNLGSGSTAPRPAGASLTPQPVRPSAAPQSSKVNGGADAFSSLFASSAGRTSAASQQGMTLAERQKLAASKALGSGAGGASANNSSSSSAWSADTDWGLLDSAARSSAGSRPLAPPSKPKAPASSDPFDFDSFTSSSTAPSRPVPAAAASKPKAATAPATAKKAAPADPFDFSEFEDPGVSQSSALGGGGGGAASRQARQAATAAAHGDDDDPFAAFNAPPKPKPTASRNDWQDHRGLEDRVGGIRLGDDDDEESSGLTGSSRARDRNGSDGLGDFSQPFDAAPRTRPAAAAAAAAAGRSKAGASGPDPPPHILGKVVEMGFGLAEGKEALLSTRDAVGNWDVNAALERLVGGSGRGGRGTPQGARQGARPPSDMEERDRKLAMRLQRQEQEASRSRRPDGSGQNSGRGTPMRNDEDGTATPEWQRQAEDLVSQASEIGASVLTRAGAFWSQAKAQAQKALEERTGDSRGGSGRNSPAPGSNDGIASRARPSRWAVPSRDNAKKEQWSGKPKWMVDAENAELGDSSTDAPITPFADSISAPNSAAPLKAAFKDSDDEGEGKAPVRAPQQQQQRSAKSSSSSAAAAAAPQRDLWDTPVEPKASSPAPSTSDRLAAPSRAAGGSGYVSPARRGTPVSRPPASAPAVSVPKIQRQHPSEPAASISRSNAAKEAGNAHFSKGAYGEAETQYGAAMESLHAASLLRVPLFNNRAQTRLRNGDANGAVEDCEEALRIILGEAAKGGIGSIYRPEAEGEIPPPYRAVDLRAGFAKALSRKAQALEMGEKWERARFDWSLLETYEKQVGSGNGAGGGGGNATMINLKAAREGMARCDKAMKGGGAAKPTSSSHGAAPPTRGGSRSDGGARQETPRQSAAARAAIDRAAQAGVDRVRAEQAALQAEEDQRLSLKDSVDSRILAWKGGKESNIRALLASIESVAWPGLNWTKVGMHQLVTDAQVKKAYTRAIAKLHPDKLTPKTTTLEERMIGTAVFSTLNDAWVAQG